MGYRFFNLQATRKLVKKMINFDTELFDEAKQDWAPHAVALALMGWGYGISDFWLSSQDDKREMYEFDSEGEGTLLVTTKYNTANLLRDTDVRRLWKELISDNSIIDGLEEFEQDVSSYFEDEELLEYLQRECDLFTEVRIDSEYYIVIRF